MDADAHMWAAIVFRVWTGVFVALAVFWRWTPPSFTLRPWAVGAIAVLVNLLPALLIGSQRTVDIDNFQYTASLVRSHMYVYSAPWPGGAIVPFHPYLPFEMFIVAAVGVVAEHSSVSFALLLKLPNIAAVGATAALIVAVATRLHDAHRATWVGLLFAFNPIVIGVSAFSGQFDMIPAGLAFAAWALLRFRSSSHEGIASSDETGSSSDGIAWSDETASSSADGIVSSGEIASSSANRIASDEIASAILLGLAILTKTWPLMLVPVLAFGLRSGMLARLRYAAIAIAVPAAVTVAYVVALGGSIGDLVDTVYHYRGLPGLTGYSAVAPHLHPSFIRDLLADTIDRGTTPVAVLLLVTLAVAIWRKRTMAEQATLLVLTIYVFSPSVAGQYYLWIVPFAAIAGQAWLVAFSVLVAFGDLHIFFDDTVARGLPTAYGEHAWIIVAASWLLCACWFTWLMCRSVPSDAGGLHSSSSAARHNSSRRLQPRKGD